MHLTLLYLTLVVCCELVNSDIANLRLNMAHLDQLQVSNRTRFHMKPEKHNNQSEDKHYPLDSNTPPLFLTKRDLYADVASHTPGKVLWTIQVTDEDGDKIEFSILPADILDCSEYFAINPKTGELSWADEPPPYFSANSQQELEPVAGEEDFLPASNISAKEYRLATRNRYLLLIGANDGHFTTQLEVHVRILNSSDTQTTLAMQMTPDGGLKGNEIDEIINSIKARVFYSLNNPSGTVLQPTFANPALNRVELASTGPVESSSPRPAKSPETVSKSDQTTQTNHQHHPQPQHHLQPHHHHHSGIKHKFQTASTIPPNLLVRANPTLPQVGSIQPQPVLVSLVVICSSLMLILVALMIIVPISVKRLRRRLKQVEVAQHEHLSHRNSHISSTICSSSLGSVLGSTQSGSHNHLPNSKMQFIMGSGTSCFTSRSSACRQSSLDSSLSLNPQVIALEPNFEAKLKSTNSQFSQFDNGSIANPLYLGQHQQQQQPQLVLNYQQFDEPIHVNHNPCLISDQSIAPMQTGARQSSNNLNIYHPLDDDQPDEFYTTINNDTCLNHAIHLTDALANPPAASHYNMVEYEPPAVVERAIQSPSGSDSGSSTRSLAKFLSLPARQSSQTISANNKAQFINEDILQLDDSTDSSCFQTAKTIARTSNVARERQTNLKVRWEIERNKIKLIKIIGEGQFGLIWMCLLRKSEFGTESIVAAKQARDKRTRNELLAEMEIMKLVCQHPNVVKILHCCTDGGPLDNSSSINRYPDLLVMEYLELGKLQSFLERSRLNHLYKTTSIYHNDTSEQREHHLTSRDLMKFIYHVAKGMEYISSHCIVHRDLASRNILLNSKRICKIGDFGMARQMQSPAGIYERHSMSTKIPVRWMAPEVLLNNAFTIKSDVFSFGILMWEIVTLGSTPYRHLETRQVIREVARDGLRPERPEYCHAQLYEIMSQCWSCKPEDRPTFGELVNQLDSLLLNANEYIQLDQYPDHNYYNVPAAELPRELV